MAEVIASPEFAADLYKQIEAQDEIIDAASGSKEAGKRKIANEVSSETEDAWKKSLSQLVTALKKTEDNKVIVGAFNGIVSGLREEFGKLSDSWLDEQVEARKSDAPSVSAEQLASAQETRKELVSQYGAVVQVLEMFGHKPEDFPKPKRMGGPRGPQGDRGPRFPKNLQWTLDGKDRSATQNNLSSIFATAVKGTEGCENMQSTKDLKTYLLEKYGFGPENVPSEFSFDLPNGKKLGGYLTADSPVDDEDETEEGNEEETSPEE